jgi:hypothetical protein
MRRVYHADAGSLNAFTISGRKRSPPAESQAKGGRRGQGLKIVAGGAEAFSGVDT